MKFGQWLGLIALLAALVLLWSLRDALILLFAAVVLAMALCTLVGAIQERIGVARPIDIMVMPADPTLPILTPKKASG